MEFNVDDMIKQDKKQIPSEEKVMGRPKKDKNTLKSERVVCYLTKDELSNLKELSDLDDLTVSNYLRKVIIKHLKDNK